MTREARLAKVLGWTVDDLIEADLSTDDLQENYGSSGEMHYGYFFRVPDDIDPEILSRSSRGIKPGEMINIATFEIDD